MAEPNSITITAIVVDSNLPAEVVITYDVITGKIPRAFALDIMVDAGKITEVGNFFVGECNDSNGYGIFPASFGRYINPASPNWADVNVNYTPVADACDLPGGTQGGIDTNGITIEMGSLYDASKGKGPPEDSGMLCSIWVDSDCRVDLALNVGRAGIVMEDGNSPDNITLIGCGVVVECTVPDVVGWTSELAQAAIIAAGFDINDITDEVSMTIADGNVISTDPPAGPASCNPASVNIVVSVGPGDFGDAPDPPYPTQLGTSNGARHKAVGVMLGVARDTEVNGQQSANCDGDDTALVPDDEDGITNLVATLTAGTVDVNVSAACYLNAWIDFTDDGDWDDTGEQIFTNQALTTGLNQLGFAVVGAVENTDLISRWRVTEDEMSVPAYTGLELNGEVEDYNDLKICHVPDVVGDPNAAAEDELIAHGFTIGVVTYECNDVIADGNVISTDPNYCNYGCDIAVDMVVSTGPCITDPNAGTCWDTANECAGQQSGDSTCDGQVNLEDLQRLQASIFTNKGEVGYDCCTDWSQDGKINLEDLQILQANIFTSGYAPSTNEQSCPP
jgi:hypothetical protein